MTARPLLGKANSSHDETMETYVAHRLASHYAKGGDPTTDNYVAHSLRADGFDASEDGTGRGTPLLPMAIRTAQTSANGHGLAEEVSHALDGAQGQAVAFAQNTRDEVREMPYAGALAAEPGAKQQSYLRSGMAVRRLTPAECEKLQGFEPGYTAIKFRGKSASDGTRYKALGNSWAIPCVRWIGERIAAVETLEVTAP